MELTREQEELIRSYLRKNLTEQEIEAGHFLEREPDSAMRRDLGELDLEFFNRFYLGHHFILPPAPIHRVLTQRLQGLIETGGRQNGVYVMPRGHAKTTIGTLGLPLWCTVYHKRTHIPIISDSWDQAKDQLSSIKSEIEENELIEEDFGSLKGSVWQASDIYTSNLVRLRALGQGMKVRGRKVGANRPDLIICHAKGTWIDCDEGHIQVEQHSTAREQKSDGYCIRVHGLPFEERVTPEHRFWSWKDGVQDWREAKDLDKDTYLGWPINVEIHTSQPILGHERHVTITERHKSDGQIVATGSGEYREFNHPWFSDPEFWWLVGLWWADGRVDSSQMILCISQSQEATIGARIEKFLRTRNKAFSVHHEDNSHYTIYSFSDISLARWLKSWIYGCHHRRAPDWVLELPLEWQEQLIKGHIDRNGYIDTSANSVCITSISLPNLLQLRAMLAHLGICASIRKGIKVGLDTIEGCAVNRSAKYDLHFRNGVSTLSYSIQDEVGHQFIRDGFLWSKFKEKIYVPEITAVAITTAEGVYTTPFGLHKNCDDLEEIQSVQSAANRDALLKWFQGSLMRAGWRDTKVVVLGNYLHHDCLLANLVANPLFDHIVFKALEEWPENLGLWDQWRSILVNLGDVNKEKHAREFFQQHEAEMLKGAKSAWPDAYPIYDLMIMRVSEGDASFNMELQNNPVDPTKQLFTYYGKYRQELRGTSTWLIPLSGRPAVELEKCAIFGFTDPSMGQSIRSDYSAIIVLAKAPTGQMFVLEADIKRRPTHEIMNDQNMYATLYHVTRWGIEKNQFQAIFAAQSALNSAQKNVYLPVTPINQTASKTMRIQSLQPDLENQFILLSENGQELLKQQLQDFPSGSFDDGPDALEGARSLARAWEPVGGAEVVQGDTHQFRQEHSRSSGSMNVGDSWEKYDKLADETIAAFREKEKQQQAQAAEHIETDDEFLHKILRVGDML